MCNQDSRLGRVSSPVETRLTGAVLDCRLPAIIIMITMIMTMMAIAMMVMMTMMTIAMKITLPTLPLPPTSPCPGDPYLCK